MNDDENFIENNANKIMKELQLNLIKKENQKFLI